MSKALLIVAAASASAGAAIAVAFTTRRPVDKYPVDRLAIQPKNSEIAVRTQNALQSPIRSAVDPTGWLQYGSPGPINDVAVRSSFMSVYDRRMRNPAWVAEHITPASTGAGGGDRKHSIFQEDTAVPLKFRASLKDYFRSGFDRGHMAPAADAKFDQRAMDETFFLTNMCPQVGEGFNRDYWAHFEDFCRRLTKKYQSVRIVTGPLYLPRLDQDGKYRVTYEMIGSPPSVAVPTHFYKIILAEPSGNHENNSQRPVTVGAFVLPNARIDNKTPLSEFSVPVEFIERASGLDFLSLLPPERRRSLCQDVDCNIVVREFPRRPQTPGPEKK